MSKPSSALTIDQARRLAIGAQGLNRGVGGRRGIEDRLARLGVLQIDAVNALVRAHYLPLFSRLGPYAREELDHLTWGPLPKRAFFECWGHEASFMPLNLYGLMRWRLARAAEGEGIYGHLAEFGRARKSFVYEVLRAVKEGGPMGAGDLNKGGRTGPWWGWSPEKMALEWLFAAGEVSVAGRRNFERLYDLTERVIPAKILRQPQLDEAEAKRGLLKVAASALGVATEKDLRDYYRLSAAAAKAGVAELVAAGELRPVTVEGWKQAAYCPAGVRIPKEVKTGCLISPFDSLIWERSRTERLFDFHYRLEFYTPAAKRVYGYHVLPFLHGSRLVGRVDLKAERAKGCLSVPAVFAEGEMDDEALKALALNLLDLAQWLGLDKIRLGRKTGLDGRLKKCLKADQRCRLL